MFKEGRIEVGKSALDCGRDVVLHAHVALFELLVQEKANVLLAKVRHFVASMSVKDRTTVDVKVVDPDVAHKDTVLLCVSVEASHQ